MILLAILHMNIHILGRIFWYYTCSCIICCDGLWRYDALCIVRFLEIEKVQIYHFDARQYYDGVVCFICHLLTVRI